MKKEKLFKCLKKGRIAPYSNFQWPEVGTWVEVEGPLSLCKNGIHLCREENLVDWLNDEIYEAEYEGERIDAKSKVLVRKARLIRKLETWNERTSILFACDCAEHVLPIFEAMHSDDKDLRFMIDIVRNAVQGKFTRKDLDTAHFLIKGIIDVLLPIRPRFVIEGAVWEAAWALILNTTKEGDSKEHEEKEWQRKRLMQYLYPEEKV